MKITVEKKVVCRRAKQEFLSDSLHVLYDFETGDKSEEVLICSRDIEDFLGDKRDIDVNVAEGIRSLVENFKITSSRYNFTIQILKDDFGVVLSLGNWFICETVEKINKRIETLQKQRVAKVTFSL